MRDEDFFIHASDRKGHSAKMSLRIPIETEHALQKVFDNRYKLNLPYTTKADIVRDALAHRLHWLQHLDAPVETDLARLTAIENLLQEEKYRKRFPEFLDELDKQVKWLLEQGSESARRHAQELVQKAYEQICATKGFWREYAMQILKARFGHLLEPWDMSRMEEQ